MPQVPGDTGQRVQEQGLNAPRLQGGGSSFGRPSRELAQAAQGLTADAQAMLEKEREKATDLRMSEERREINAWWQQNVLDPNSGARSKQGRDAIGLSDTLPRDFDDFTKERMKGLASNLERDEYTKLIDMNRAKLGEWAADHEFKQVTAYEHAERLASIESEKEMAAADPAGAPLNLAVVMADAVELGESRGLGPEATLQLMRSHVTDFHVRVIQRQLSNGQDLTAKTYFETHEKEMDPDVATQLRGQLRRGSMTGESQRLTDAIMEKYGTPAEAKDAALEIEDPELRDLVRRRVASRILEKQETIFEGILLQSEKLPGTPIDFLVSPSDIDFLSAAQRAALWKRRTPPDELTKEGRKALLDFAELARKPGGLQGLSRMDFETKYYSRLPEKWRARILTDWQGATSASAGQAFQSSFTDDELVIRALGVAGVAEIERTDTMAVARKRGDDARKAITDLQERFEEKRKVFHADHGRNPNDQEKKDMLKELATDQATVTMQRTFWDNFWWWDYDLPLADVEPQDLERVYVSYGRIPTPSVDSLVAIAAENGVKLNPDENEDHKFRIQRAYAASMKKDDDLMREILVGDR